MDIKLEFPAKFLVVYDQGKNLGILNITKRISKEDFSSSMFKLYTIQKPTASIFKKDSMVVLNKMNQATKVVFPYTRSVRLNPSTFLFQKYHYMYLFDQKYCQCETPLQEDDFVLLDSLKNLKYNTNQ